MVRTLHYYVGVHRDEEVRKRSSSGGAFSAITDAVFATEPSPVVYGCVWGDGLRVMHGRAVSLDERNRMCGSKYVQSDVDDCYILAGKDLAQGKFVCFSGAPCQVEALNLLLGAKKIDCANLLTISFSCHGVGSRRFFRDYIEHMEKRFGSRATSVNFRAKSKPGKLQDMEIFFENGRAYRAASTRSDWFYSLYLSNFIIRPSCFACAYAGGPRPADIDLADAWGYGGIGGKAASLVIANTDKGELWVSRIRDVLNLKRVGVDEVNQPQLSQPALKPESYEEFWRIYDEGGFIAAQKWFGNATPRGLTVAALIRIADGLNLRRLRRR